MKRLLALMMTIIIAVMACSCADDKPMIIGDDLSITDYVNQQDESDGCLITEINGDTLVVMPFNYDPDDGKNVKGEKIRMSDDIALYELEVYSEIDTEDGSVKEESNSREIDEDELCEAVSMGNAFGYIEKEDNKAVQIVLYGKTEVQK